MAVERLDEILKTATLNAMACGGEAICHAREPNFGKLQRLFAVICNEQAAGTQNARRTTFRQGCEIGVDHRVLQFVQTCIR